MASLKIIRKRIISVRNTRKITKAMKMVAAAKLRRAQTRLNNARPYADKTQRLLSQIVRLSEESPHPVFNKRESVRTAELLVLTSDRGLCGGFNGTLLRRVESYLKQKEAALGLVRISVFGRKGREFFRSRKRDLKEVKTGLTETVPFDEFLKMANDLITRYTGHTDDRFDEFYLVYNYFRSAISQEVRIEPIIPLAIGSSDGGDGKTEYLPEYIYEPVRQELLDHLIPRAIAVILQRAYLESVTGELAARMVAMDSATNNCSDMIHDLTLEMNRLRQAAITKELMDIVNGAEALK